MPSYELTQLNIEVVGVESADVAADTRIGPSRVEHHEFILVQEGLLDCTIDGERIPAPPGAMLLLRPGMNAELHTDSLRRSRFAVLRFDLTAEDGVLPGRAEWPRGRVLPEGDIARALFDHASLLWPSGAPAAARLAQNAVRQLLAVFLTAGERTGSDRPSELPPAVERALTYTKGLWTDHPLKSPTLDQLASAAGVSSGHLSRLFRDSLGVAPLGALRLLRLERAATELATTGRTIKEIAHQAGFESQFHFSRCFKKVFGDSPSTFRDRMLGSAQRSDPPPRSAASPAERWNSVTALVH